MIDLNGEWMLEISGQQIPVQVPGVVEKYVEKRDDRSTCCYKRNFSVDLNKTRRYILHCEGVSYRYNLYINNEFVCEHEGIWTEKKIDITSWLKKENSICIEVIRPNFDKQSDYYFRSVLFGFIPDVLMPFSGIFRSVYIVEKKTFYFKDVSIQTLYETGEIVVQCDVERDKDTQIKVGVFFDNKKEKEIESKESTIRIKVNPHYWSSHHPNLYEVTVELIQNGKSIDDYMGRCGFRQIEKVGNQIRVNGQQEFFRGILHWGYDPEEMSVRMSEEKIRKELRQIKAQGFNGIKFCLFVPDKLYYDLCDEMGIFIWQELPLWLPYNQGLVEQRIRQQFPEIIHQYIHRPSLLLTSIGCELDDTVSQPVLDKIYDVIDAYNTSVIICDNSGSGECYEGNVNTKTDIYDYHFYGEIQDMENLIHAFNHESRERKPWFFGEYNDMDSFRNMEKLKQKGIVPYWASPDASKNLLRYVHAGFGSDNPVYFFDTITESYGYRQEMEKIEKLSIQKAYDVRKMNLETTRVHGTLSGYSITAIRDVPITACGFVDDCGALKYSEEKMCSVNGEIVIAMLPRLGRKWYKGSDILETSDLFSFRNDQILDNRIIISSHLQYDIQGELKIELVNSEGESVAVRSVNIDVKGCESKQYHQLDVPFLKKKKIERYTLKLEFAGYKNQWNIWSYPKAYTRHDFLLYDPSNMFEGIDDIFSCQHKRNIDTVEGKILVTTVYNQRVDEALEKGIHVIYIQQGEGLMEYDALPFWRENVKIIENHPVLEQLKHKGYDGLNFLSLTTKIGFDSKKVRERFPEYQSFIRRIDNRNFRMHEYAFKVSNKKGNLLVTSFDFSGGKGIQARTFETNYMAQGMLDVLLKLVAREELK